MISAQPAGIDVATGDGVLRLTRVQIAGRNATSAADFINAGAGNDFVNGGGGADTIIGGAGNDTLTGGFGVGASVDGGPGNDLIFQVNGTPEFIDGGTGIDTLNTTAFGGNYRVNLVTGATNFRARPSSTSRT